MAEYTYEDIIMDPEDPRLEGAIGKECFFADYPTKLLENARSNSSIISWYRLRSVRKDEAYPFTDEDGHTWILIIIKKEEEPEYINFESVEEFLDAYFLNKEKYTTGILLKLEGIWLREKETGAICMATEIWDEGLVIGDTKLTISGTDVFNDTTDWEELLKNYTFIDGTQCGKLMEDKND